jgi:autotransporter-associated beta strand protein
VKSIRIIVRHPHCVPLAASILAVLELASAHAHAADILWSSSGGSAWLTGSNWTGSAVPTATDNAQIGANPTGSGGVGITFSNPTNAGTQTNGNRIEDVGAIELTSARTSGNPVVGNSSSTAGATGTLRLKGITVNSVANVILRLNSSQNLTIQDTQGSGNQTMAVSLGNTTENKVVIDGSGTLAISSVIKSDTAMTPLTILGSGSGRFDVTNPANTFTGDIKITGAEVRFSADGSLGNANNNIIIDGGRFASVSGGTFTISSTHNIFIGDTAGTSISAPGSGTLTYNAGIADISGKTGAWAKQGGGTLALGGVSSYTGATAINNGTVQLTTGNNRLPAGTVVSIGQASSANVGTLDLNGRDQEIAGLQSTAGTNATASRNLVTSATAATLTINNSSDYTFSVGTTQNSGNLTGALSVIKKGAGTQTLGGANTYTGTTRVLGGILSVAGDSQLGTAPVAVADNLFLDGGRLELTSSGTLNANRNILLGATAGTSLSTKGGSTVINFNGLFKDLDGSTTGALVKNGGGTLAFGGSSTYTGATVINNGTLQLTAGSDRLPTGTVVSVGETGTANVGKLDLNGRSQLIAGLSSNTGTNATTDKNTVTSATAATLTLGGSANYNYGDGTTQNSGVISGLISVVKTGSGTQTLGDANTYTGKTTINAGTLKVNNDGSTAVGKITGSTAADAIKVNSGGTLLLSGTGNHDRLADTAGITLNGGLFKRDLGASEGTGASTSNGLDFSGTNAIGLGALILSADSTLDFGSGGAGTLAFTSFDPGAFKLNILNYATTASGSNLNLSGTDGTDDRLIFNQDLASANVLNGISFAGVGAAQISLGGGFYEVVPIPEPSTIFGAGALLGLVGFRERRRLCRLGLQAVRRG